MGTRWTTTRWVALSTLLGALTMASGCGAAAGAGGDDPGDTTAGPSFGTTADVVTADVVSIQDTVEETATPEPETMVVDVTPPEDVGPHAVDDSIGHDGDAETVELEPPPAECDDPHFAPPDCTQCTPEFIGVSCDACADPRRAPPACTDCLPEFTGDDCDACSDPHRAPPECTGCLPEFTGDDCDTCSDPAQTGPECDACTYPGFIAPECTYCQPQFTGLYCDECANPHQALPDCITCLPLFVGATCDQCADDMFTGVDCDVCTDPHYEAPECTTCLPEFEGVSCAECAEPHFVPPDCTACIPLFTGEDCDECVNPHYEAPECTTCLPAFTGNGCAECVDPHYAEPDCDTCAEGFTGEDCDVCADPTFTGPLCDQCANPQFTGANCDTCVPGYTGSNCDQCIDCADPIGCSDGSRDELADLGQWPTVAACEGSFGYMSLRAERTNTACGDDIGVECSAPEDLCAEGWHICMRNGSGADLRYRLTWQECKTLSKPFVAASNNCSNPSTQNPNGPGCDMTEPLGCYSDGWCSAPPVCGPFETSHCAHAVWPTKTYIFGKHAGKTVNQGCGHISTSVEIVTWGTSNTVSLAGVLCCQD